MKYLTDRGVSVDDVIATSLSTVEVSATPTLLLIDSRGRVKNVWIGKLDSNQEAEVIQVTFRL